MRCLSLMKGVMWVWAGGPQERSLGTRGSYLGSTKRLNTREILCLTNLRPLPEILKQNLRDMDPNCTPFKGSHVILLQASACCPAPFFFFFYTKDMQNSSPALVMELGSGLLSENGPTSQLTHEPQSGFQASFTLTFSDNRYSWWASCYCMTNYPILSDSEQLTFIILQFLWVRSVEAA